MPATQGSSTDARLANPEFIRLFQAYQAALQPMKDAGAANLTPQMLAQAQAAAKAFTDYANANKIIVGQDAQGNPTVRDSEKNIWKDIGKTLAYMGIAAGGYFAAPVIAGALGGAGGAAGGAAGAAGAGGGAAAAGTAAGAAGAAGATGGVLSSLGGVSGILGAVGPIAGAISGARGAGRLAEGNYDLQRGQVESQRAATNSVIDDRRMQQALRLALLGGATDAPNQAPAHIASHMGMSGGGLRPSALAGREDIIAAMKPRIMESLMSGNHVPELPDAPDSNWLDKLLEGTSYAGAISGALQRKPATPAPGINVAATNPNIVSNLGTSFGQPKPRRGLLGY